jgi:hypothetical protein
MEVASILALIALGVAIIFLLNGKVYRAAAARFSEEINDLRGGGLDLLRIQYPLTTPGRSTGAGRFRQGSTFLAKIGKSRSTIR